MTRPCPEPPYKSPTRQWQVSAIKQPISSFGLLPNRLDCAAALVPGILTYETESEGEVSLAVDEGVLVKTGNEVLVSVRNAIGGMELGELHEAIEQEFLNRDAQEQSVRSVLAKLEGDLIRRFATLNHD